MPIELDTTHHGGARLKVIGVGGAGGNAVRTMVERNLENVEFIAANTDAQALLRNPAPVKIHLGNGSTRGLGAGANPEVGRSAVEESISDIRECLSGADMVFVTAGMGGGTGTGAAPIVAREARELGALVVGIVTRPFAFENKKRSAVAEQGIELLREHVDALIVIPNDRILSVVDASVPFKMALEKADEVLYNATKGIADIILHEGMINVDFADVATVMRNQGDALMGIGTASGERRAMEAAQNALNSPILEGMQIYGAKGLLVNITGGASLTLHEVMEAVSCIKAAAGDEANLIHGVVTNNEMDDEISVTVVATGFHADEAQRKSAPSQPKTSPLSVVVNRTADPSATPSSPEQEPAVEPVYRPAASSDLEILRPHGSVNKEDLELPAVWRRREELLKKQAKLQPDVAPEPAPVATRVSGASVPITIKRPVPQSQAQPQVDDEPEASSSTQPETFLRPRKSASAGGGNSQPAFLRKIMD